MSYEPVTYTQMKHRKTKGKSKLTQMQVEVRMESGKCKTVDPGRLLVQTKVALADSGEGDQGAGHIIPK